MQVVPELWFPADTAPREVLARAATRFSPRIAFATGFGMEGCVLLHMIAARRLPIDVFTLDTGLLFPETYVLWKRLDVVEAILRVFHRLGNRKDKAKARMKFLIAELGWEGWKREFESSFEEVRNEGLPWLPFDAEAPPVEDEPGTSREAAPSLAEVAAQAVATRLHGPGLLPSVEPVFSSSSGTFTRWSKTNVRPQKQAGETATAFFRRVELGHVKPLLADLENVTPANVRPEDFIDLEEEANFTIETKEGECAA